MLLSTASGARDWVSHSGGLALDDCCLIFLVWWQFLDRLWGHGREAASMSLGWWTRDHLS